MITSQNSLRSPNSSNKVEIPGKTTNLTTGRNKSI